MDNSDERDYAEEAYNQHTMHTGDGEVENCTDPYCPYYSDDPGEIRYFEQFSTKSQH